MENVILEDSPLAEFLEGASSAVRPSRAMLTAMLGEGRGSPPPSAVCSPPPQAQSFAPRGPSTLQSRLRDKLPRPLRVHSGRNGSITRIHGAWSVRTLPPLTPVLLLMHG